MNISTHAGQTILQLIDGDPSAPGPWQQLMLLCFDQRDIETFETLRLVLDGLHKVHAARKQVAKKQFEEAVARMRASGVQSSEALPRPVAATFVLTEVQRTALMQLARAPNSTRTLERAGRIFAEDWEQPDVAQKFYERAMCYEAENDDVLRSLAQAVETLSEHMPRHGRISGNLPSTSGPRFGDQEENPNLQEMTRRTGPLPGDTVRMRLLQGQDITRKLPAPAAEDTLTLAGVQGFLQRISSLSKPILQAAKLLENAQTASTPLPPPSESAAPVEPSARALQAQELLEGGHLVEAESLLKQDSKDETVWPVWVNLGLSHFEQGRVEEAIQSFQTAVQFEAHAVEPHFNLGVALFRAGRTQEAIQAYRTAQSLDPDNAKVACNLGAVYFREGQLEEAEAAFRDAIKHQPDYAKAWDNLASVLGASNRLEEAEEACRKAIEINPYYAEPKFKLGTVLYHLGRREEAHQIFEEVVKLRPDWTDTHLYLALIHAREKNSEAALASYRMVEGVEADPELSALVCLSLGELFEETDLERAISYYKIATDLNPHHGRAWGILSQACLLAQDSEQGLEAARKWTEVAPNTFAAWQHLGSVHYGFDQFWDATQAFQHAAALAPDSSSIWCDLSASLQMNGDVPGAIEALERAVQADSASAQPYLRMGHIYLHQKDVPAALASFARASECADATGEVFSDLAQVHESHGEMDAALVARLRARDMDPENPVAWENLSLTYARAGNQEKAEETMSRAVVLRG